MDKARRETLITLLLVLFSAAVYISLIFNNNIWMDEAFTASLIKTDYAGVLERSMNDTLPPLYNLLLKLWTDIFGLRIPVMKLLSASFMIITVITGAFLTKRNFGFRVSSAFILALTFMPNMLFFGVEIRMYSLGFCFSTISGLLSLNCLKRPSFKNWTAFTLVSVLSGYSHHFALITVGFVYLFMLIYFIIKDRKGIRSWLCCLGASFMLYLPCMLVTLRQLERVNGYFSMPEVTPSVFIKYMRYPYTTGFTPLSLLLSAVVFALLLKLAAELYKERKNPSSAEEDDRLLGLEGYYSLSCFLIYYGVLVFGTLVSKLMTANIFVDRYLFFAHGLLWLFFSIEASKLKKPLYIAIIVLELLIGAVTYSQAVASEYAPGADRLMEWLGNNVSEGDLLYTVEDAEGLSLSLPFYDDRLTWREDPSELEDPSLQSPSGTIWLAVLDGYEELIPDTGDYKPVYIDDFSFDRYRFRMYKLRKD